MKMKNETTPNNGVSYFHAIGMRRSNSGKAMHIQLTFLQGTAQETDKSCRNETDSVCLEAQTMHGGPGRGGNLRS